jgi:hypothetical protein
VKMGCSLSGKIVDRCCCVEREGKLHCCREGVEECCCTPVKSENGRATSQRESDGETLPPPVRFCAAILPPWAARGGYDPLGGISDPAQSPSRQQ